MRAPSLMIGLACGLALMSSGPVQAQEAGRTLELPRMVVGCADIKYMAPWFDIIKAGDETVFHVFTRGLTSTSGCKIFPQTTRIEIARRGSASESDALHVTDNGAGVVLIREAGSEDAWLFTLQAILG